MASLIGRKLGQYEITSELGRGGMAAVYKARQQSVGRDVAIKVLPPHPGLDEQFIQRFELEARTIGGLQHPHILPVFDYGRDGDVLYLVMAYIDGGALDDSIDRGPMPPHRVENILRQIAGALDYAHRRGVIHRDIKPANILMDGEGNALLADFGIVKMIGAQGDLTGTGIVGTPAYMSPEQGQGLEIDGRADVYALAAVVFEMLTGQQPYHSNTPMQVILQHINEPAPALDSVKPDLPPSLTPILKQGMAKNPDERYQTAIAFAEAFSTALHENTASLAGVRAAQPLEATTSAPATQVPASETQPQNATQNPATTSQTIIMRDSVNPLVLLGGFGLIALVIVIVAVLLIDQRDVPFIAGTGPTPTPLVSAAETPAGEAAEPTAIVVAPVETETPTFGLLRYSTTNTLGDTVNLQAEGLQPLGADASYVAWLVNTDDDVVLSLGRLSVDGFGEGLLSYTDEEERTLAAQFNAIWLTREPREGELGDAPTGDIVYSGQIPVAVKRAMREVFVASEQGINGSSLLEGAQTEALTARQHSGLAANSSTIGGMRTHAEHTVNILNGTQEDYDGDGRGVNPGRGVGLYAQLEAIETLVTEAAQDESASVDTQINSEFIRVCVLNARNWSDRIIELENILLSAEDVASVEAQAVESTELASAVLEGVDANENGQVEPFEGECGLNQIPDFGLAFGRMNLFEGDVTDA